ncbi:MAG: AMP-binding protein [Alphaproteobacteria bacterium]|nr:AMP-binding protein [Alphaproteobacteria bacterium]
MPAHPVTVPQALARAAATWPTRSALEDGEARLTWAELARQAHAVASSLVDRGIRPGDRVAIWAPNSWAWVLAALGSHLAGATLVPLNTRYKGAEATDILDRSGARLLFVAEGFLGLDLAGMLDRPDLPMLRLPADLPALLATPPGPLPEVDPEQPSDVLFTSGTTGRPKGVLTSQRQTVTTFTTWAETVGLRADDRYLVVAPFFHAFGYKAGLLACVLTGATMLPQPVFDAGQVLARLQPDRVSVLPGPPALYESLLLADRTGVDLSGLRLAVTGAAVVPEVLVRRMREELGFETVLTAYGLTEACGVVTMCRQGDDDATIASTSGRAIPDVEVRVVDAEGRSLPPGEPGEVVVRGYNVMLGYLDDPTATADAVREGWLHTGDVGVLDARGCLRITDRLKDMFIVGGFNAYPAEIELALAGHPDVREVAVVGVPDPRLGEVGLAFVVPQDGPPDEAALIAWARERMANFKVPRAVRVVDALPRNASGKVDKVALRRLA